MMTDLRRLRDSNFFIYLVLVFSVAYLAFIALSIHEGIFYAGDEGIKSLVTKQIAQGYGFKYLHLPQPAWVKDIWRAGFTPLRQPTFYHSQAGYEIVYPPAFQIVSAWLYEKWGPGGLYIIPMASTAVLLLWLVGLLKRSGVKPPMIALAVFILVFCSPLALYGVMFWEHLPAVLLLFGGLSFIVNPPRQAYVAATLGIISGLAVFLRPEALMMNFLYGAAIVIMLFRDKKIAQQQQPQQKQPQPFFNVSRPVPIAFLAGLALPVLAFFCFNKVEYGAILGIHSRQVFLDHDPDTRLSFHHGLQNLVQNNYISTHNFMLVLLLIPLIVAALRKKLRKDLRPLVLALIVLAYSVLTPWVLPNNGVVQWGARYFLPIIPVALVALFLAQRNWDIQVIRRPAPSIGARPLPRWILFLAVLGITYSFYHNTHGGGYKEVRWRYNQRLTNTYKMIDSHPGNVVILSHHWMINDFAWLFDKDYFFAASSNDSLRRLLPLLKENGVRHYIFVFDPRVPSLPTMLKDSSTSRWWTLRAHNVYVKNDYAAKVYAIN